MRAFGVVAVGLLCGCMGKPEGGTELRFDAPGIGGGSAVNVILTAPTPSAPVEQRTAPTALTEANVVYYKQAVFVGALDHSFADLDHAVIQLGAQPGAGVAHYTPFVIVGDLSAPTAIGTVAGTDAAPGVIDIPAAGTDTTNSFTIDLEPVAAPNADGTISAGEYELVPCAPSGDPSGFVWQPMAGGQLRVLLSDDGNALARTLDLDCDNATADATNADCDDTRPTFHPGAPEACDQEDENCDGLLLPIASPCTPSATDTQCTTGVSFCDDATGVANPTCFPDASCHAAGSVTCQVPADAGQANYTPCNLSTGIIQLTACSAATPCLVRVAGATNNWRAGLSLVSDTGNAGAQQLIVPSDHVYLDVTLHGNLIMNGDGSYGTVDLTVEPMGGALQYLGVVLDQGAPNVCGSPTPMTCSANVPPG